MMTLVASALAGGDCIDDADALRAGGTARPASCQPFLRSTGEISPFRYSSARRRGSER